MNNQSAASAKDDRNDKMPLISIIIPLYNTEKYIERCVNSICSQTYKNIEIIIVNDKSTDQSLNIAKKLAEKDLRIRVISHEYNKGLYHARITGVENANGDYIGFVDSDDHISCDYFCVLLDNAELNGSDIVVGKAVHENEDGYRYIHNLYSFYDFGVLSGDDIARRYWEQEGYCFIWHTVWNKLYSRKIWEKALPILKEQNQHLIMAEDFLFSSVLFNYAEKLSCVEYGAYFYFQHGGASTSLSGGMSKFRKNISDLGIAFGFIGKYISDGIYRCDIKEHYNKWRKLYVKFWTDNITFSALDQQGKNEMFGLLSENLGSTDEDFKTPSYFYSATTQYDMRYENISEKISSYKYDVVSFDIFDTALLRPFYKPTDIFMLMNNDFADMACDETRSFSEIRIKAEALVRKEKIYNNSSARKDDISIDDIYDEILKICCLSAENAEILKQKEIALELEYCKPRKSVYNLYKLALAAGKRVIFTSDMYLHKETIEKMLRKCGYDKYDDILVSCDYNASKRTGALYNVLIAKCDYSDNRIIHIGDNWDSDYISAKNKKIEPVFFPKTIECLLYSISDIKSTHTCCAYKQPTGTTVNYEKSMEFPGVRTALALAANKLYDNPFISYNEWSESNCSPQFLGYYMLGMHLLGYVKWLVERSVQDGYETLAFISRDGYLPLNAYDIVKKYYKSVPDPTYLYMSRKSVIPCDINNVADLYALYGSINPAKCTIKDFISLLSPILNIDDDTVEHGSVNLDDPMGDYSEFCDKCDKIFNEFYDASKSRKYDRIVGDYIVRNTSGKCAVVDIGYSGRTQEMIKRITGKTVDAFYVHVNDDACSMREKRYGFSVKSFFEFTPSITGGIRELLFSEYSPSCIGYSEDGEPLREKFAQNYPEYYLISEIQKNALDFVNDFCTCFGEHMEIMNMRNIDISYPYEFFLGTLTDFDANMFQCCDFEDDMWAGKNFSLPQYWKDSIAYHKIQPFWKKGETVREVFVETNRNTTSSRSPEWELFYKTGTDKKSKLSKALFWFVVDKNEFKSRLRKDKGKKG